MESGAKFCMKLHRMLQFGDMSIHMNMYRFPSLKQYYSDAIGDVGAKEHMEIITFFKIRKKPEMYSG